MSTEPTLNASDPQPLSLEQMVAEDRIARQIRAKAAIEAALEANRCEMAAVPSIVDGRIVAAITLTAK